MTENLIASLLLATPKEAEWFFAQQIDPALFAEHRAKLQWLGSYYARHAALPTQAAFIGRYPDIELPHLKKPSLEAAVRDLQDFRLYTDLTTHVGKARDAYAGGETIQAVVEGLRESLQSLDTQQGHSLDVDLAGSNVALDEYARRAKAAASKEYQLAPTPWPTMNRLAGYMDGGQSVILAARTSMGKTWLLLRWASYLRDCGLRVVLISKEMSLEQISLRVEAITHRLPYPLLVRAALSHQHLGEWKRSRWLHQRRCKGHLIVVPEDDRMLKSGGFAPIEAAVNKHHPHVLIVDGAYLIDPGKTYNNEVAQYAAISAFLKRLSARRRLLSIAALQTNRDSEGNDAKDEGFSRPTLRNIYGADRWAQDADFVMLLGGKRDASTRLLSLAKGRDSAVGDLTVNFHIMPCPMFDEANTTENLAQRVKLLGDKPPDIAVQ